MRKIKSFVILLAATSFFSGAGFARFVTPDPLFLENPDLCVKSPTECNLYSYAKNNPLIYVDPSGTLTIAMNGTYAKDADWAKPNSPFMKSVEKTFGETPVYLSWSGRNDASGRTAGAEKLAAYLSQPEVVARLMSGEKLNIVAHSHGGNVVKEYSNNPMARKFDTVVNIGTPQRDDYQMNMSKVGNYINGYSNNDPVQIKGAGESLEWITGSPSSGRTDPAARNVEINLDNFFWNAHSDLHTPQGWSPIDQALRNQK